MLLRDGTFQPRKRSSLTLETVLSSPDYFGLETISPLQRAICRALDGLPLGPLCEDLEIIAAFGGAEALLQLPQARPAEFVLLAGIRCGKSLLSAAGAVRAALTCDVSTLTAGDIPRVSVLSLSVDTARATWNHVRGHVEASPALRALLLKDPTADMLVLRHPSGRPIEIRIVAGSRAAGSLVARWSAGNIFDEAPRMVGAEDGVVNIDEARQATVGRLLPGAQNLLIGSPWAPFGPVYDLVSESFGKPTRGLVIVRAPAYAMNPAHWTPERCEDLRTKSIDAYNTDVLCKFMDPVQGLFTLAELEAAQRAEPLELAADRRFSYVAAMDPATRGNGWSLVVTTNLGKVNGRDKYAVALTRHWQGSKSKPLDPREILTEIAGILRPYGVSSVLTDEWSLDTLRTVAADCNIGLIEVRSSGSERYDRFSTVRLKLTDGALELPPDPMLIRDLASTRKVVTQQGMSIQLHDSPDGRHADSAVALALALSRSLMLPAPLEPTGDAALRAESAREREEARKAVERRQNEAWRGYR